MQTWVVAPVSRIQSVSEYLVLRPEPPDTLGRFCAAGGLEEIRIALTSGSRPMLDSGPDSAAFWPADT